MKGLSEACSSTAIKFGSFTVICCSMLVLTKVTGTATAIPFPQTKALSSTKI